MSWWNSAPAASPGSARVLRGPRVSATRPASLLVDPELLRRFAPPEPEINGNGHAHDDEEEAAADVVVAPSEPEYDPAVEAARLEQLAAELEDNRRTAFEDGYQRGVLAGREQQRSELEEATRIAEERREGTIQSAASALLEAVQRVEDSRVEAVAVAESECAELAFKLTRALVARETHLSHNATIDSIVRALNLAPTNEAVVIRLNPDDITTLSEFDMSQVGRECTIVADDSVEHAGCVVEVGPTRIDAQMGRALGRVRKALLGLGHDHDPDLEGHGVSYSDVSAHPGRSAAEAAEDVGAPPVASPARGPGGEEGVA